VTLGRAGSGLGAGSVLTTGGPCACACERLESRAAATSAGNLSGMSSIKVGNSTGLNRVESGACAAAAVVEDADDDAAVEDTWCIELLDPAMILAAESAEWDARAS